MDSIKNSMRYIQLGIAVKKQHNYSLRKWQRVLWYVTLYTWRILLASSLILLIYKLIY
jgi:hypothetical protein